MIYELLSGNYIVAEINDDFSIIIKDYNRVPYYFLNGGEFISWVSGRSLSDNRGITARNIKKASGLSYSLSSFETVMKVNAACITDNYWVRKKGEDITYSNIEFKNYKGELSDISLGFNFEDIKAIVQHNPELTNIGDSDKAWIIDNDGIRWLYKKQPLFECFCEVLTSCIAKSFNINTVDYLLDFASDPDPELGRYGIVKSKDFTQSINANLEHARSILIDVNEYSIKDVSKVFYEMGLINEYLGLIFLDIITKNPDRHIYNYGVLRDRDTGELIGMAPNYDNNFCFRGSPKVDEFIEVMNYYSWEIPQPDIIDLSYIESKFPNYDINNYVNVVNKLIAEINTEKGIDQDYLLKIKNKGRSK